MKCKKCGGILKYNNGVFLCENCNSKYTIREYYENIDVYLCYIENDDSGRRTKDSVIAQELYSVFEENGIETFYPRISASNLIESEFEKTCENALCFSKIIIVLGTQKGYFDKLSFEYSNYFKDKTVLPLFADTETNSIPKNISTIQAIDYNKVGSKVDLINSVLNILGREKEVDLLDVSKKANSKKKITIIAIIISILIVIFSAGAYVVFEQH